LARSPGSADAPAKRLFDVMMAVCALIATAPLMVAVAAGIRLSMGAPVLFRQARPGLGGRPFMLLKFRTMTVVEDDRPELDHEQDLASRQARITRLGSWLRRTSLDELPELWNVLRGDMSIVGPRPLLLEYLPHYSPEQMRRHEARPGITGLAQVSGRHALGWDERFRLDRWYVDHWTFRLDVRILRDTARVLLHGQGSFESGSEPQRFDVVATAGPLPASDHPERDHPESRS
jgi:lipopolysaccharide/colanic/teichoic acid biosynthesis glycosyltransferase